MRNNGQKSFDFLDALATQNLSPYESRVLSVILKWHLVYRNGGVIITLAQICDQTKLGHGHACRALRGLLRKQILFKSQKNRLNFYSFTSPVEASPVEARSPLEASPVEAVKLPQEARPLLINNSNEVIISNAGSADQIRTFTSEYPGSWFKDVKAKAEKIFAGMGPDDQAKALKALRVYKSSKSVQEGRIFSPVNFLSAEIIDKYSKEAVPAPREAGLTHETVQEWRREASAPPGGSFKAAFEQVVAQTAAEKSINQKGEGNE